MIFQRLGARAKPYLRPLRRALTLLEAPSLEWNPRLELVFEKAATGNVVTLEAPVPGRARQSWRIEERMRPDMFSRLRVLAANGLVKTRPRELGLDADAIHELRLLGLLLPRSRGGDSPRYENVLAASGRPAPEGASLRGDVWIQHGESLPEIAQGFDADALSERRPIVWHRASPLAPLLPFWPDPMLAAQIESSAAGRAITLDRALADIGLVAATEWNVDSDSGAALRERGAIVEDAVIAEPHVRALADYYGRLIADGWLEIRKGFSSRWAAYDEPVGRMVQAALLPWIQAIAGEPLKPSYTYFVRYLPSAELPPHRDRPQCRYTISLLLEYRVDGAPLAGPSPWPLWMQRGDAAPMPLTQKAGDGIVYLGPELWHWRERLPGNATSSSLLIHYVPRDFVGTVA